MNLQDTPLGDDSVGLLEGLCTTRAIRRYTTDPIPPRVLRDILFCATRAPSGSNRQPFRFVVLTDGERAAAAKALIGQAARNLWSAKRANDQYDKGSGADPNSPKSRMARTMQHYVDHIEQVPCLILPCMVRYRDPTPTEGASVYPAVQNLMLAARGLGYGGVITGFHGAVESELKTFAGDSCGRIHGLHRHPGQTCRSSWPGQTSPHAGAGVWRQLGFRPGLGRGSAGHPAHQRRPAQDNQLSQLGRFGRLRRCLAFPPLSPCSERAC